MRRAVALASVAGIGAVGGLLTPVTSAGPSAMTTAGAALAQRLGGPAGPGTAQVSGSLGAVPMALPGVTPAQPRVMFVGVNSSTSPDDAADLWDVVGADGSDASSVLESASTASRGYSSPSYSPDGLRAVAASEIDSDEGTGQRLVVTELATGQVDPLPTDWTTGTWDADPDWSADGARIAFTRRVEDDPAGGLARLQVFEEGDDETPAAVGDPFEELDAADVVRLEGLHVLDPAWSPDGTRIVFVAAGEGTVGDLWVLDLSAAALYPVTTSDGARAWGHGPDWSPDGDLIGYVDGLRTGPPLIVGAVGAVTDSDDGPVLPLDERVLQLAVSSDPPLGLFGSRDPAWSPDGREIAVRATDVNASVEGIYAVTVDDGVYRTVVDAGSGFFWTTLEEPAYQPWSDLAVELTVTDSAAAGQVLDLTATVTNAGPSPAWGLEVVVELPGAVQSLELAVSVPVGCTREGGNLRCELTEPLGVGEEATLGIPVTVPRPGSFTAEAAVTADSADPLTGDNHISLPVEVSHPPAVGEEPRLAFTYRGWTGDGDNSHADIADVLAADGSDVRMVAHEVVVDDDGGRHPAMERQPSYSPDGRRMVFGGQTHELDLGGDAPSLLWNRTLMVADVASGPDATSTVRPLEYDREEHHEDTSPVWSPDGTQIAFLRRDGRSDGYPSLAVLEVGAPEVRLIEPEEWDVGGGSPGTPSWAPDAERLVIEAPGPDGWGVWVVHVEEGLVHQVVTRSDECGTAPDECLVQLEGSEPAWSPDGGHLALEWSTGQQRVIATVPIGELTTTETGEAVYLVDEPELRALPDPTDQESLSVVEPTWSLDSQQVTYVERRTGGRDRLLTVPAAGGSPTVLLDDVRATPYELADLVYQPWADVGVTLSADTPALTGEAFGLRATVTNHGPSPAWGSEVSVAIPALASGEAVLESLPDECEAAASGVDCSLAEPLPVDEPVALDLTVRVAEPGDHAASATLTTDMIDPAQANNSAATSLAVRDLPAGGLEPRLAFTRQAVQAPDDASADVADVPAHDGPHDVARLLAHQTVQTAEGQTLVVEETHPGYSPDGTTLLFSATPLVDGAALGRPRLALGDLVPGEVPGDEPALINIRFLDYEFLAGARDEQPAWSPDGRRIALVRDDRDGDGDREVALVDVATGTVRPLTPPDVSGLESMSPAWSPGGDRLAVEATPDNEAAELWIVHLDPAGDQWYPVGSQVPGCIADPWECFVPAPGAAPVWSPDGARVAAGDALLDDGEPWGYSAVHVYDIPAEPAGDHYPVSASRILVGTPQYHEGEPEPGQLAAAWHPAWSPDGTEVTVVGRAQLGGPDVLYAVPAGDGAPDVRVAEWSADWPGRYGDPAYQPWSDVGLRLEGPAEPTSADDLIEVTAVVVNAGPSAAWGLTVAIALPPGLDALWWDGECTQAGTVLTCVDAGPVTDEYRVTIVFDAVGPGTYELGGTLATTTLDPRTTDNTDTAQVAVTPAAPAEGIEPRLAFTYRSFLGGNGEEYPGDVADVLGADGSDFRVVADERLLDPTGRAHRPVEAHPSYSPDGRRMVYSSARELVDPDTGEEYELHWSAGLMVGATQPGPTGLVDVAPLDYERPEGASDGEPAWSPDGTRIAFIRSHEGSDLALVDVTTGEVRLADLTGGQGPLWLGAPAWSPDGQRLVVEERSESSRLWVVHLAEDGTAAAFPVVTEPVTCEDPDGGCERDLEGGGASWSPDGTSLAFVDGYWTVGEQFVQGLYTVTLPAAPDGNVYRAGPPTLVAGADPERDEPLAPDDVRYLADPDWALDGTSLAFAGSTDAEGASSVIYTVPADGGTPPAVLRADVREGVRHDFADLEYQPWADVGVTVAAAAPETETGEPLQVTVTVTNHGPSPAWGAGVDVTLPGETRRVSDLPAGCVTTDILLTCTGAESLPVGAAESYVFTLVADTPGEYLTTARVAVRSLDLVPDNDEATATFRAVDPTDPGPDPDTAGDLAVSLELGAPTAWVGGDPVTATVVVTNAGPDPADGVAVVLTSLPQVDRTAADDCAVIGECALGTVAPGASRTIVVELLPREQGQGAVTATVRATTPDPDQANDSAAAELEVRQPELRLLPAVATPGEATLAYGVDFPPGAELELRWDRGITAWSRPVTVREDGTVRSPMLVLPGDELGDRLLLATHAGGPGFGELESPPLLVVPRTSSPPDFITRGR